MFNRKDETSLASLVRDGKAQSLIRILYGCVSFMLNSHVGIRYFGVFTGMEGYSRMTRYKVMGRSFKYMTPLSWMMGSQIMDRRPSI